jgi:hypothetical protein
MKRYLIFAILTILALSIPAFSVLESHKCGPYLISFNLTTTERMNISQLKPIYYSDNVQYGLQLKDRNGNECGLIGVCTFYHPAESYISPDNLASFIESSFNNTSHSRITRTQRAIDGYPGFLVTGTNSSGNLNWIAEYWIIRGSTEVEIHGNLVWEMEDIIALLDSIHVERVGF